MIPRLSSQRNPLYSEAPTASSIENRIINWHRSYHQLISEAVTQSTKLFEKTLLLDIHSMPKSSPDLPDFVVGNLSGVSASGEFSDTIVSVINQFGFTYSLNNPYAGGFITEHYGNPSKNQHAIQLEINRNLYLKKNYKIISKAASELTEVIKEIIKSVSSLC